MKISEMNEAECEYFRLNLGMETVKAGFTGRFHGKLGQTWRDSSLVWDVETKTPEGMKTKRLFDSGMVKARLIPAIIAKKTLVSFIKKHPGCGHSDGYAFRIDSDGLSCLAFCRKSGSGYVFAGSCYETAMLDDSIRRSRRLMIV